MLILIDKLHQKNDMLRGKVSLLSFSLQMFKIFFMLCKLCLNHDVSGLGLLYIETVIRELSLENAPISSQRQTPRYAAYLVGAPLALFRLEPFHQIVLRL